MIAGRRYISPQYADDTKVFLSSPAQLNPLELDMKTFGKATNQYLNLPKLKILPLAKDAEPQIPQRQVVKAVTGLGICFSQQENLIQDQWPTKLDAVHSCINRLAGLHLSAFGRAFALSSYALSKILYHVEFMGLPPDIMISKVQSRCSRLLDHGHFRCRITGIPYIAMLGSPKEGGFGLIPFEQHVKSRHACLLIRTLNLLFQDIHHPYAFLVLDLLAHNSPTYTPLALLTLGRTYKLLRDISRSRPEYMSLFNRIKRLMSSVELQRWTEALATLPPPQDIDPNPIVFGPWVWATPLWGNPFFTSPLGFSFEMMCPVVSCHGKLIFIANLYYAYQVALTFLVRFIDPVLGTLIDRNPVATHTWYAILQTGLVGIMPPVGSPLYTFPKGPRLLIDAFNSLPPLWKDYCESHQIPPLQTLNSHSRAAQNILCCRLGWVQHADSFKVLDLTVRQATWLVSGPSRQYRSKHYDFFHVEAFATPLPPTFGDLRETFLNTLHRLWRIPWENSNKEAFWRLAIDGFSMLGNSHIRREPPPPCPCLRAGQVVTSPRLHYFWECSLAQALVQVLTVVSGTPVLRHQLWLAIPPTTVSGKVWDVVCLAAISALREGWVFLCTHQSPLDLHLGKTMVVATFWSHLTCFASLHKRLFESWSDLPPHHPFLVWRDGDIHLHRP